MIVTALIFIILGIVIKNGKYYNLIAGYNTLSKEEKAKYNIEKIATLFRNVMFFMAAIILIGYIISRYIENEQITFYTIIGVTVIGTTYLLIKSNSKAYKNLPKDQTNANN
jgi:magnesium-transporting ATPase (P-type)